MKIYNLQDFVNCSEPFVAFSSKYGIITFNEITTIIKTRGCNDCLGDNTHMTYTNTLIVGDYSFIYEYYTYKDIMGFEEHYDDYFTIVDNRITNMDKWKELFDKHTKEELFEILKDTDYAL